MKDITKKYSNGEVTIVWKPNTCIHSEMCFHGLPEVFNPAEKPWIKAEAATTARIIAQIKQCPSGALSYYMNGEEEANTEIQAESIVEATKNGPLLVYGNIIVKKPESAIKFIVHYFFFDVLLFNMAHDIIRSKSIEVSSYALAGSIVIDSLAFFFSMTIDLMFYIRKLRPNIMLLILALGVLVFQELSVFIVAKESFLKAFIKQLTFKENPAASYSLDFLIIWFISNAVSLILAIYFWSRGLRLTAIDNSKSNSAL